MWCVVILTALVTLNSPLPFHFRTRCVVVVLLLPSSTQDSTIASTTTTTHSLPVAAQLLVDCHRLTFRPPLSHRRASLARYIFACHLARLISVNRLNLLSLFHRRPLCVSPLPLLVSLSSRQSPAGLALSRSHPFFTLRSAPPRCLSVYASTSLSSLSAWSCRCLLLPRFVAAVAIVGFQRTCALRLPRLLLLVSLPLLPHL